MKISSIAYSPARNYYQKTNAKVQSNQNGITNQHSEPSFKSWGNALSGGAVGTAVGAAGVFLMWAPILGDKFCNILKGKL